MVKSQQSGKEEARPSLSEARRSPLALASLLESFRPMLERLSSDAIDDRLSAKTSRSEIAQITIVTAMESFHQFRGMNIDEFRAWLLQIFDNLVTDLNRRYILSQKRSVAREEPLISDMITHNIKPPSQIAMTQEDHQRLLEAMENLPAELRQIVQLRYWGDQTFQEIAEYLQSPIATVRRRWLEAIEHLGRILG